MPLDLKSKFLGAMIGSALGDAIGELAFSSPARHTLLSTVEQTSQLRYTDDTAMGLGLAESIIECRSIDQQHLGETFSKNFQREPWRGYASGPPTVFSLVEERGITYPQASQTLFKGQGSFGNGAAMRIVPVGLFFHLSPDLYKQASLSAQVTHAHPVGMDGAAVQARAVAEALNLDPRDGFYVEPFISELVDFAKTFQIKKKMELVRELIEKDIPPNTAAEQLGQSVAVHESMPFALYSFLSHPGSFKECLYCATLNGGDRDTLGAMACAISGAYLGVEAIPQMWREKLENLAYIEDLASSLAQHSNQ